MASVVWLSVFVFLCAELFVIYLLALPLPRLLRRFIARKICTYDLGRRVRFVGNFISLGLFLAVVDSIQTQRHLDDKEDESRTSGAYPDQRGLNMGISLDKQRKFRAERNMYLAGFALTLMFAIQRIVELMQATTDKEDENEVLKKRLADQSETTSRVTTLEDSTENAATGAPGSTPYTLRRRNVSSNGQADHDNADHED